MKIVNYILIFSSLTVFSQNEFKKKTVSGAGISVPLAPPPAATTSKPVLFALPIPTFSKAKDPFSKPSDIQIVQKKEPEVNLQKNTGYVNPNIEVIKQQNEKFKHVDLGTITLNSNYIIVKFRDFGSPDGDIVRITNNQEPIEFQVLLESDYKDVRINLSLGKNNLEFFALNQGSDGANTAEFVIIDESGKVVFANQWALLTGEAGQVVISKEK